MCALISQLFPWISAFGLFRNSLSKQGPRLFVIQKQSRGSRSKAVCQKSAKIWHHNSPPSCGCVLLKSTLPDIRNLVREDVLPQQCKTFWNPSAQGQRNLILKHVQRQYPSKFMIYVIPILQLLPWASLKCPAFCIVTLHLEQCIVILHVILVPKGPIPSLTSNEDA